MATAAGLKGNYLPEVKSQYEDYPYPPVDPEDERKRFRAAAGDGFGVINHLCYGGGRDFSQKQRILIAGGGTGNSAICMAEQGLASGSEIVYLDLSNASMAIAQRRAEIRGLTNIRFLQASLLDIPQLELGSFDIVHCTGVLHHLADPDAGLAALCHALKPDGVLVLMLYAEYGRAPVYQMQAMMRTLCDAQDAPETKVRLCRTLLNSLPSWHILRHYAHGIAQEFMQSDIGLYDVFLHSQDRPYSVPELYAFLDRQQLNLLAFAEGSGSYVAGYEPYGPRMYNPLSFLQEGELRERAEALPEREQHRLAELMSGQMTCHAFYAARFAPLPMLSPEAADIAVPYFSPVFGEADYAAFHKAFTDMPEGQAVEIGLPSQHRKLPVRKTPELAALLKYMDGQKTLAEIYQAVRDDAGFRALKTDAATLTAEFSRFYEAMSRFHWLLLRRKGIAAPPSFAQMQRRMYQRTKAIYSVSK